MRHKLLCIFLVCLLAVLPLTANAQEFDPNQLGSVSVSLVSKDGSTPVEGAELSVYQVATSEFANGTLLYRFTEAFADCGLQLDDPDLILKLDPDVSGDCRKMITDAQGNGTCRDLPRGLYFVKQTVEAEGFAPCASFLVTIPMETENGYQYHVNATPKMDVVRLTDITIQKVWNTGNTGKHPTSVTVQLLRHEEVLETAVLNKQNDWQVIYPDMPESDAYSIKELDVPKGFTATYAQRGYVFTVTNTGTLIQTGQVVWPIPVFALLGIVLLMLGFVILKKPGEHHA